MRKFIFRCTHNRHLPIIVGHAWVACLALSFLFLSGCGSESSSTVTSTATTAATAPTAATATSTTAGTGGRIQMAETSFDFGTVHVEQQVEHSFEIRNVGPGVLNLGQLEVKRLEGC